MVLLILFVTGFTILAIVINRDLNRQLSEYERKEAEQRETLSQAASASEESNQVDTKRVSGQSKKSTKKRKANSGENKG